MGVRNFDGIGILFFGFFILLLILGIYSVRKSFQGKSGRLNSITISNVLYKYEYFRKLTNEQRIRFIKTLNSFNRKINYYGEQGLVVTDEMRIIIGAGFAKMSISNNFKKLYFFHSILLFPKAYHDEARRLKHLGKTSPHGYIAFSWEDVLKGEADLHDGVNLAIHEFAHAYVVEMMQAQNHFELEYFLVRQIYMTGTREKEAFERGKLPVLRKYAYSSPHEFFAVSVEIFFELPEKLINNHWKTYRNLCLLFNQNPLANEIGKINWNSILEYPHVQGTFASLKETKSFEFISKENNKILIEVDNRETRIIKKGVFGKTIEFICPHNSFIYATSEGSNNQDIAFDNYQLSLFYLKNNKITSSTFITYDYNCISEVIDLYNKIGLSS